MHRKNLSKVFLGQVIDQKRSSLSKFNKIKRSGRPEGYPINFQSSMEKENNSRHRYLKKNINHQSLEKEQMNQLYERIRIQNVKLAYLEKNQKRTIQNLSNGYLKNILKENHQLKKRLSNCQSSLSKAKRRVKLTKINQIEAQNQEYIQEIKRLNCEIKAYFVLKNQNRINTINKIVESQYYTSISNKNLSERIKELELKEYHYLKNISKMELQIKDKDDNIQFMKKQKKEYLKISSQVVSKHEFEQKKKENISLVQTIMNLQKKIIQYEVKIQTLKQEAIENINQQVQRRNSLAIAYESINNYCNKLVVAIEPNNQGLNSATFLQKKYSNQNKYLKKPNVKLTDIQSSLRNIIYKLQIKLISSSQAIQIILSNSTNEISILNIMVGLQNYPFQLNDKQMRQKIGRYVIEENQYLNKSVKIDIARSIFKILFNYQIFSNEIKDQYIRQVKQYQCIFTQYLNEQKLITSNQQQQMWTKDIINYISEDKRLSQEVIQFIRFQTHVICQQKVTIEKFFKYAVQ